MPPKGVKTGNEPKLETNYLRYWIIKSAEEPLLHDHFHRRRAARRPRSCRCRPRRGPPLTSDDLFAAIDKGVAWRSEHEQRGTHGEINFSIRSESAYLQQANDMLADMYAHTPLTERRIKDLRQAVLETGGNAIEWGRRKNADLVLQITYRIYPDHITLVIRDQGPGFNPGKLPHAACDDDPIGHIDVRNDLGIREGGFGIMLAKGLVDDFKYNDVGNEVTLVKRFDPAKG
jgi:anti-sigma regulatory factor (Ser/Thr protein kinase)